MKYIEKDYPATERQVSTLPHYLSKLPYSVLKKRATAMIPNLRSSMGGISKCITMRPVVMEDVYIKGYKDDIRIRLYYPKEPAVTQRPLQLFIHGGGWFGGNIHIVEEYCKAIADRADAVIASVDYHLAPEHKYPCGLHDNYNALKWLWAHSEELGTDRNHYTISGDSAGGGYSAALTMMARDEGVISLSGQVLLYPCVRISDKGIVNPTGSNEVFGRLVMDWYLGDQHEWDNPLVSPILGDFKGLPKAIVVICEFDELRHEGLEYAQKLSGAGVETVCYMYKNTQHAFIDNTGTLKQAADLIKDVSEFIKSC